MLPRSRPEKARSPDARGRIVRRGLALLAGLVLVGVFSAPASAGTGIDDYPYITGKQWRSPAAQDSVVDSWGMYNRECVSFVAWRLSTRNGYEIPFHDNAYLWKGDAQALGILVDTTPAVGAVAWWGQSPSRPFGHVAWVKYYNDQDNTVTIEEYNADNTGFYKEETIAKTNPTNYIHFQDPPGTRLMGDVNGDGKADAVVKFSDSGLAMVALSTGSTFATPGSWANTQTVGADKYFLEDVSGDGKADLVAFWETGVWYASLSNGSNFQTETQFATGQGVGSSSQFLSDVNGDGKADLVLWWKSSGNWYVSLSSGSVFGSPQLWRSGHGVGSADQQVADFTGDGKADAGIWISNGNWHVGASNGTNGFGYPNQWSAGHGVNSGKRIVGKASADSKADVAYYHGYSGDWDVGTSSGSGFWAPTRWETGAGVGSADQFIADATGDGKADMITFSEPTGKWYVATSNGSNGFGFPNQWITGHGAQS